jgi:hemerythrin-like domain-containing protein
MVSSIRVVSCAPRAQRVWFARRVPPGALVARESGGARVDGTPRALRDGRRDPRRRVVAGGARSAEEGAMDGLDLLKSDHDEVKAMFERFDEAGSLVQMRQLADRIVQALEMHAMIEERAFYPELRRYAEDDLADQVLESLEEHQLVKRLCEELRLIDEDDERFEAKMKVLRDLVEHHVEEEESGLFPTLRKVIAKEDLRMIGEAIRQAKATAEGRASAPADRPSLH